jgi:hypothetical protein
MSAQRCSAKLPASALRTGCPAHEIMAVLGHKTSRRLCGFADHFSENWLSIASLMQSLPVVPICRE